MARAGIEGRGEELIGLMAEAGMLRDPERATPEGVIAQFRGYTWWFTTDEVLELDPTVATRIMHRLRATRAGPVRRVRHGSASRRAVFGRRVEMMTLAVDGPAAPARQLVPDRARVVLRRRAADRAGAGRGRLLRAAPLMERRSRTLTLIRGIGPRTRLMMLGARRAVGVPRSGAVGLAVGAHGRDWFDDFGWAGPIVFIMLSSLLTVVCFPGPLLAGAARPALRHGARHADGDHRGDARSDARVRARAASSRATRSRSWRARDPGARGWVARRGFVSVLYARLRPGCPTTSSTTHAA